MYFLNIFSGSFGWAISETCAKEGFWPDIISTDLHTESVEGPSYDLTTAMTRMLRVGMPLSQVIAATTSRPAAVMRKGDKMGSLKVWLCYFSFCVFLFV